MERTDTIDALITALVAKRGRFDQAPAHERVSGLDLTPEFEVLDAEIIGLRLVLRSHLTVHLVELLDAIAWDGGDLDAYGARGLLVSLKDRGFDDASRYTGTIDQRLCFLATMAWQISQADGDRDRAIRLGMPQCVEPFDVGADAHFQVAVRLVDHLGLPAPTFAKDDA